MIIKYSIIIFIILYNIIIFFYLDTKLEKHFNRYDVIQFIRKNS